MSEPILVCSACLSPVDGAPKKSNCCRARVMSERAIEALDEAATKEAAIDARRIAETK